MAAEHNREEHPPNLDEIRQWVRDTDEIRWTDANAKAWHRDAKFLLAELERVEAERDTVRTATKFWKRLARAEISDDRRSALKEARAALAREQARAERARVLLDDAFQAADAAAHTTGLATSRFARAAIDDARRALAAGTATKEPSPSPTVLRDEEYHRAEDES